MFKFNLLLIEIIIMWEVLTFIGIILANFAWDYWDNHKLLSNPDSFLEDITEKIESGLYPKYTLISMLDRGIKKHPNHQGIQTKLTEIKENYNVGTTPRTLYIVLSSILFIIGLFFLYLETQLINETTQHNYWFPNSVLILSFVFYFLARKAKAFPVKEN